MSDRERSARTTSAEFRCPCGGTFQSIEMAEQGAQGLLHSLPQCATFENLEPLAFLRWARRNGATVVQ